MDKNRSISNVSDSSSSLSSSTTVKKTKNSSSVIASASGGATTATVNNNEITKSTNRNTVLPRPVRRILQNFLIVWLDANLDESNDDFKNSLQQLRRIVASITIFTDAQECIAFISEIKKEKVFMIVSGSLGRQIIPDIQTWSQLESIYVFCNNQSIDEEWSRKIAKVKGVYTRIEPICESLQIDRENCDRNMISISFDGIDALFMYTQLLKESLLEIEEDDEKSIKELVDYCRLQDDIAENQIGKVEREYPCRTPIWWYTGPYFMYSMLNRGLRLMEVDIILKMGFFIRHLHQHIKELYQEQQQSTTNTTTMTPFEVFRGQGLSIEIFDKIKQTKGRLMSFNNFLSTSRDRQISLCFAESAAYQPNTVGTLFIMLIDPNICATSSIPFADVNQVGYYKDLEEEILFSAHTIFHIDYIERIHDNDTDRLWQVNLTLTANDNHQLKTLTEHLRQEYKETTGWSRLGDILIRLGEYAKAEELYTILIEQSSSASTSDKNQAEYCNQLGTVYNNMGEYSKALLSYERSLEIRKIAFPPNHPDLATSYNNIGLVHKNVGEYSKALSSYERSLEIRKIALPPNHPDLATSYNNIGSVYNNMGEYSKALSSYERSLEIRKIALPPNHFDLATSYNSIGIVYDNLGEYSKALSSYERSLEIRKIALPPNHPSLAASYNNIGLLYYNMGEYSKALSYYEKDLEISQKSLPPNYPSLATAYNNIGVVYRSMGEYSKALSSYERSLEIRKIALPPNHHDFAQSYNNIGLVYDKMGEYSKALSSYERSLEIRKIALPPNHPSLAASYNNIGELCHHMGEYSKALSSYERSLEIRKIALPPNHPDLATSYNNIGSVYNNTGEYSKALSNYEKAQVIWEKSLPPNHPDIAINKTNIEVVREKL